MRLPGRRKIRHFDGRSGARIEADELPLCSVSPTTVSVGPIAARRRGPLSGRSAAAADRAHPGGPAKESWSWTKRPPTWTSPPKNEVKQALSELTPRPTTLVIVRRYSMVKNADHVVVLAQGESVQQGTPEELVPAGGWFATLAMQSTRDVD